MKGSNRWSRLCFRIWLEYKLLTKEGRLEVRHLVKSLYYGYHYGSGFPYPSIYWLTPRVRSKINWMV